MPDLTLGLDLGPNSIGWALLDEAGGQLLGTGVRVPSNPKTSNVVSHVA